MTNYLRFPDETAAMSAIEAAGFTTTDEDGTVVTIRDTHDYSLDPVGILYNDDAIVDPETGEIILTIQCSTSEDATGLLGWREVL